MGPRFRKGSNWYPEWSTPCSRERMAEEGRGQSRPSGHFCIGSIRAWGSLPALKAQSTWAFSLHPHHSTHLLHQPSLRLLSSLEVLKGSGILAGGNRWLQTLPGAESLWLPPLSPQWPPLSYIKRWLLASSRSDCRQPSSRRRNHYQVTRLQVPWPGTDLNNPAPSSFLRPQQVPAHFDQ